MSWQKIPVENFQLKEMALSGHGKRCSLYIITSNPESKIYIPMTDPSVEVKINGKMRTQSFNHDDMDLGIKYLPEEDMKITLLEIDFPGEPDEWINSLRDFKEAKSEFIHWVIRDVKIILDVQ